MLYKAKTLKGYRLESLDGEIGKVKEFYFDDQYWTIRYLVADTAGNSCLAGRQVLISPYALVAVMKEAQHIAIDLTKMQIERSPTLSTDKPVSLQFEEEYHRHYGFPNYWSGLFMWGAHANIVRDRQKWKETNHDKKSWDSHLCSTHDVTGYHIQASDGEFGHIEDFIIDDDTWAIRYLIIDTRSWWPGKKILIPPQWIERVGWSESKVFVNVSRETVKQSQEYTEAFLLTRDGETRHHGHYHRQGYWVDESAPNEHLS